jgi:hypothetical protein
MPDVTKGLTVKSSELEEKVPSLSVLSLLYVSSFLCVRPHDSLR